MADEIHELNKNEIKDIESQIGESVISPLQKIKTHWKLKKMMNSNKYGGS